MGMRRCLMKFQITGRPIADNSNFTGGLLSKQHPHHHQHQLKLHGIRALSEWPRGTSSSNPKPEPGSQQEHLHSSMESEIEKLRVEIKMMDTKLQRHISASANSSSSSQLEEKRAISSAKMEVISDYAKFINNLINDELVPAALGALLIMSIIGLCMVLVGLLVAMVSRWDEMGRDGIASQKNKSPPKPIPF